MTPSPRKIGKFMSAALLSDGGWQVTNKPGTLLGTIEWNPDWRQHEFVPEPCTAFTASCLAPLAEFLTELDNARRAK